MATPLFCCGFECGISGTGGQHWQFASGGPTFDTTTIRTGLRSLKLSGGEAAFSNVVFSASNDWVLRFYVLYTTLPSTSCSVLTSPVGGSIVRCGAYFNASDSKIYAGTSTSAMGSTGVAVTTNVWYCIDVRVDAGQNPWTVDVQVDGQACGQATNAAAAATATVFHIGGIAGGTGSGLVSYFEDGIVSQTLADYPLGPGYVLSYIPNEDGDGSSANRHNGLSANEVERTFTGTDIVNTTTTAYQLVDDRPFETVATDFINWKTNGAVGDYVEIGYENSVEAVAPRTVEAIVGWHDQGGAGTENFSVTLRESGGGTTADIIAAAARNNGDVMAWARAHFATVPGTSDAWTTTKFNALRSRILATDASPDVNIDGLMLEAEFQEVASGPLSGMDAQHQASVSLLRF